MLTFGLRFVSFKITVTSDLGHVLYLIESSILVSLKEITIYEVQDFGQNGK